MPHSTLTVGNVEITVLHDSEVALPFSRTFPDVPAEAWAPYQAIPGLTPRPLPVMTACGCILSAIWFGLKAAHWW